MGGDETSGSVKCGEFIGFAARSGLPKAIRVIVVLDFYLLCKCFMSDPEFPRHLSAVCNFF